ncbi:MAG: hypothetical protein Q7S05_01100 [bacterium]|nr:hypothetical protein [bacterium]
MREDFKQGKSQRQNIDKGSKSQESMSAMQARIKQIGSQIADANDDDSDKMLAELGQLIGKRREMRAAPALASSVSASAPKQESANTGKPDALDEVRQILGNGTVFFGQKNSTDYAQSGREFTGGWNIVGAERRGASGEFHVIIERGGERVYASTENLSRENPNTKFFETELSGEKLGDQLEVGGFKIGEYVVTERAIRHFVSGSATKVARFSVDGKFAYIGPTGFKKEYLKVAIGELRTSTPKIGDSIRIFLGTRSQTKEPITVRALEELGDNYLINKVRGEDSESYTASKDSILIVK